MTEIHSLVGRTGTFRIVREATQDEAYYILKGGIGTKGFNQRNGRLNSFNFNEWGQHEDYRIFELNQDELEEVKAKFL
jgi:hypothetical protein